MKKMFLKHKKDEKLKVEYYLETITKVIHGKCKDFYSKEDIVGNGVKPNDSMIMIIFNDGSRASFGSSWEITFE